MRLRSEGELRRRSVPTIEAPQKVSLSSHHRQALQDDVEKRLIHRVRATSEHLRLRTRLAFSPAYLLWNGALPRTNDASSLQSIPKRCPAKTLQPSTLSRRQL